MHRIILLLAICLFGSFLTSCDSGIKWKSGKYAVYWIDLPSELTLGLELKDGNSIGRVGPRVCAVGEDDTWIVAARYATTDKSEKQYYYFPKATDHPYKNANQIVLGPFTEIEFFAHKKRLSLPDWEKHF